MSSQDPVITRRRLPSAIWFLPLLTIIIAGWLVYKNYSTKGISIEVTFDSASGLEANKTKVLYRGLPVGVVKELKIDHDLRRVNARIEMVPEVVDTLTDQTQFWLVKPQVSLSGVRGLETLLSGQYIGFQPGLDGHSLRFFKALDEPPPPLKDSDGLYLTLTADSAHSIYPGAQIYYRDIGIGEVLSHKLSDNGQEVLIETYIEPRFAYLVRENTRFWNASGIKVSADLPKIDVQIGSLASIIAGGIHISTPDTDSPEAHQEQGFHLYKDFEAAEDGIDVTLRFPGATELATGARVMSNGIQVGRVKNLQLSDDYQHLDATLLMDPRTRHLLREGSRFWLNTPSLSLDKLGNLSELLRGSYIELEPGQGAEIHQFTALDIAPAKRQLSEGKSITLHSPRLGSISKGSPVLYRQLPVGEVTGYELDNQGTQVAIYAQIEKRYAHLVTDQSRFWNVSGIDFQASLKNISLKTESASALLRGGIAFFNPPTSTGGGNKKQNDNQRAVSGLFTLYENFDTASEEGRLLLSDRKQAFAVRLHTEEGGSIKPDDPILYKQQQVGRITRTSLNPDGNSLTLYGEVDARYKHLVTEGSRFWQASGISAEASLKQVNIQTESLQALLSGAVAFANYDQGAPVKANHLFTLYPSKQAGRQQPLRVEIRFPVGKNIQPLADVRFRGQIIGQVKKIEVEQEGLALLAHIDLYRDGHFLAREGSRFWVVSPKFDLTGIRHPEGMITGNYIEATQGTGAAQFHFTGLAKAPVDYNLPGLNLEIHASDLGSLMLGSPVFFRKLPVGSITGFDLTEDGRHIAVFANIAPEYSHLVKNTSEFDNASGLRFNMSLLDGVEFRADSLATLIGGGLSFTTPQEGKPARSGDIFVIKEM